MLTTASVTISLLMKLLSISKTLQIVSTNLKLSITDELSILCFIYKINIFKALFLVEFYCVIN